MLGIGQSGSLAIVPSGWSLLFAREPEPDIDDLPPGADDNPGQRLLGNKPPNRRMLLWAVALVVAAGVAYFLTQSDEPPVVAKPAKPAVSPRPAIPAPPPASSAPAAPGTPPAGTPAPVPPGPVTPAPVTPSTSSPGAFAPGPGSAPPPVARPSLPVPTPMFKEGQHVVVQPDPKQLTGTVFLSFDSAGVLPGPLVKPGSTLTVVDGELRNNTWMYSVRTEDGAIGWIQESRLKIKS